MAVWVNHKQTLLYTLLYYHLWWYQTHTIPMTVTGLMGSFSYSQPLCNEISARIKHLWQQYIDGQSKYLLAQITTKYMTVFLITSGNPIWRTRFAAIFVSLYGLAHGSYICNCSGDHSQALFVFELPLGRLISSLPGISGNCLYKSFLELTHSNIHHRRHFIWLCNGRMYNMQGFILLYYAGQHIRATDIHCLQ